MGQLKSIFVIKNLNNKPKPNIKKDEENDNNYALVSQMIRFNFSFRSLILRKLIIFLRNVKCRECLISLHNLLEFLLVRNPRCLLKPNSLLLLVGQLGDISPWIILISQIINSIHQFILVILVNNIFFFFIIIIIRPRLLSTSLLVNLLSQLKHLERNLGLSF